MGHAGVTKAYREAHLIQANTEKTETGEGEEIAERARLLVSFEIGGEGREVRGDGVDGEHEGGRGNYAERRESERLEGAECDFDGEIVDGPDGHDESDAGDKDGTCGTVAVGGFYMHGRRRSEGIESLGLYVSVEERMESRVKTTQRR